MYLPGIQHLLNPALFPPTPLFPAAPAFVTEHLRFSLFAPLVAALTRITHLPLSVVVFLLYLAGTALTLAAAWHLLTRLQASLLAHIGAVTLLALWLTLPIAGTSLLLADPYLTARTLTTPLILFALAAALRPTRISILSCTAAILLAATLHPLMAGYGLAAILCLLALRLPVPRSRRTAALALLLVAILAATLLYALSPPEPPGYLPIVLSRYYWFPTLWHWYELLGLFAPLLLLSVLSRKAAPARKLLAHAAILLALIALVITLVFVHPGSTTHLVARMQPLRVFQVVYIVLALLLGAWLAEHLLNRSPLRWAALILTLGGIFFYVQRQTYPSGVHLELPGRTPRNPWGQAFLWARDHTPADALFALDPHYITRPGQDAQSFRAIALRNVLPDYSKDGGEASITPALTHAWTLGQQAQAALDTEPDAGRIARLRPLGVTWLVLPATSTTAFACTYANTAVKVCRLP